VNKKKQKNFINLGRAGFTATGPEERKFLRRFFQKAAAFLPRPLLVYPASCPQNQIS
jgi:hypothetical protein